MRSLAIVLGESRAEAEGGRGEYFSNIQIYYMVILARGTNVPHGHLQGVKMYDMVTYKSSKCNVMHLVLGHRPGLQKKNKTYTISYLPAVQYLI